MDDGYYHGINKLKKPATKVMAPPGGETHINVFEEPAPEALKPVNKCQEQRTKSSVFSGPADMNPSRSPAAAAPARQTSTSSYDEKADQHTSTKVLAPPGGKSNFSIFGGSEEETKPQAAASQTKKQSTAVTSQKVTGTCNDDKGAPAKKQPAQSGGHNIFGGGNDEVIGQRARNRKPPGGESHNIFG